MSKDMQTTMVSSLSNNHIRVVARIRPMNRQEEDKGSRVKLHPVWPETDDPPPLLLTPSATESKLSCDHDPLLDSTPLVCNTRIHNSRLPQPKSFLSTCTTDTKTNSPSTPKAKPNSSRPSVPITRLVAETTTTSFSSPSSRNFAFDAVLPPDATQSDVYRATVGESVSRNAFAGYHTTILAYGQTGSGKTYTMMGASAGISDSNSRSVDDSPSSHSPRLNDGDGVIPRAVHDLFRTRQLQCAQGKIVSMDLTYLEIYNDELRDLLSETMQGETTILSPSSSTLKLRDHGSNTAEGIVVQGLTRVAVDSMADVHTYMEQAHRNRTTGSTRLNERSSRSHAICTLTVTTKTTSASRSGAHSTNTTQAKLTLVDLAGSERIKETGVVGLQQQESININKDLFVLGKVVSALSQETKGHVPYRDSKLTRLLRDSLGGNCCTVLIACVSPADMHVEESINTLRYAERSRSITNSLQQNVLHVSASQKLAAFATDVRAENKRLKAHVALLQKQLEQSRLVDDKTDEYGTDETEIASPNNKSYMDAEFSGLQAKLKEAEKAAKAAREHSRTVAVTADRWREHYAKLKNRSDMNCSRWGVDDDSSFISSCLSYELSIAGTDGEHLADEDLHLGLVISKESPKGVDAFRFCAELERLTQQKIELAQELSELLKKVDGKQTELYEMETQFNRRMGSMATDIEKQRQLRDVLAEEVCKMKLRIQLMSSDLKEDATSQHSMRSIFRTFSKDKSEGSEVEMQSIGIRAKSSQRSNGFDGKEQLQKMGKLLAEKTMEFEELETRFDAVEQENASLIRERDVLLMSNETLTSEVSILQSKLAEGFEPMKVAPYFDTSGRCDKSYVTVKNPNQGESNMNGIALKPESEKAEDEMTTANYEFEKECLPLALRDAELCAADTNSVRSRRDRIRTHAERMLILAEQALDEKHYTSSQSICSSMASSVGTELRPLAKESTSKGELDRNRSALMRTEPDSDTHDVISNLSEIDEAAKCKCESSMFERNADHAEFYLPKLGVKCLCGRNRVGSTLQGGDPCALSNILRVWQVQFLETQRIGDAVGFVHAHNQRSALLAKEMRRWRRAKKLESVKTKSCSVALHIWSRTCKAVLKSVREQQANGIENPQRPDFLDVSVLSDNRTVSTLGLASVMEEKSGCDE